MGQGNTGAVDHPHATVHPELVGRGGGFKSFAGLNHGPLQPFGGQVITGRQ
jgi:hypothetical protein